MSVRLFVGSLPYDTTEEELREYLSAVGPLTFLSLPRDRETNKPRGFAFAEFGDPAQAAEAIRRFNGQPFKGRLLSINEARARESRPQTGAPRPAPFRSERSFESGSGESSQRDEKPNRNFGPDAAPRRRSRKQTKRGSNAPGGPKKPLSEKMGGRFFGVEEDWDDAEDESSEVSPSGMSEAEDEEIG